MLRSVKFSDLNEAQLELVRISEAKAVETAGVWSLYQIYTHLAESFENSISAYPRKPLPRFVRKTIGRIVFNRMLKKGVMPHGAPNPTAPKIREEGDVRAAYSRLRKAIEKFHKHDGQMAVHPTFDRLTKEEFTVLHRLHIANHLSFVNYDEDGINRRTKISDSKDSRKKPGKKAVAGKRSSRA